MLIGRRGWSPALDSTLYGSAQISDVGRGSDWLPLFTVHRLAASHRAQRRTIRRRLQLGALH